MSESQNKRGRSSNAQARKAFNQRVKELIQEMQPNALNQVTQAGRVQQDVAAEVLTLEEGEEELDRIEEHFNSGKWQSEPGNKAVDLPPLPGLVPAKNVKPRGFAADKEAASTAKDVFASAGIDLQEESQVLMSSMAVTGGPAVRNKFRGSDRDGEPVFCNRAVVLKVMKKALQQAGLTARTDARLEELLCIAIETRMMQVLRQLAKATRAADGDQGEFGPVKFVYDPQTELRRLEGAEEAAQMRKAKKEKEELQKLAETDKEDVRVKALLEEQARQRSAVASSEAAIAMARGSRPKAALKPRASAIKAELPGPEVRVAQARLAEGVASPEDQKMIEDWNRRSNAVAAGRRRVETDKQRPERRVGVKELMFVMDTDPYFKSVRMQSTLKSGFLGRGAPGEKRIIFKE